MRWTTFNSKRFHKRYLRNMSVCNFFHITSHTQQTSAWLHWHYINSLQKSSYMKLEFLPIAIITSHSETFDAFRWLPYMSLRSFKQYVANLWWELSQLWPTVMPDGRSPGPQVPTTTFQEVLAILWALVISCHGSDCVYYAKWQSVKHRTILLCTCLSRYSLSLLFLTYT